MTKPDDSSLKPKELREVEKRARALLDRASAWERFPTPIEDILEAARVEVASSNAFDPVAIMRYIRKRTENAANYLKSALSKVLGIYDAADRIIHVDSNVVKPKQRFLKLHETGHHEMPTHRKLFQFFQDCRKTLEPEISDLFEREANNFARFALFQGDCYRRVAADCALEIKTSMTLAKKFGASQYASAREFARTNHRACVVYILEPVEYVPGNGAQATVRRVEPSPSFEARFGRPLDTLITLDHPLGPILPLGRKMTGPTTLSLKDRNGRAYECVAEAFNTTYNILILLYPVRELTTSRIIFASPLESTYYLARHFRDKRRPTLQKEVGPPKPLLSSENAPQS